MNAHLILVQLVFFQSKQNISIKTKSEFSFLTKDLNKTVENYVYKITEIGYKTFSIKSNKKTKIPRLLGICGKIIVPSLSRGKSLMSK